MKTCGFSLALHSGWKDVPLTMNQNIDVCPPDFVHPWVVQVYQVEVNFLVEHDVSV